MYCDFIRYINYQFYINGTDIYFISVGSLFILAIIYYIYLHVFINLSLLAYTSYSNNALEYTLSNIKSNYFNDVILCRLNANASMIILETTSLNKIYITYLGNPNL